jgi:hypothetical protein
MRAVGIGGLVVSLAGVVVAERLLSDIDHGVDRSLALTGQALENVAGTIAVAQRILGTVTDSLGTVSTITGDVATSAHNSADVISKVTDLSGTQLPNALDAVNRALPGLIIAADGIDEALKLLARTPFGPATEPSSSLGQSVRQISDGLAGLPTTIRNVSSSLASLSTSATSLDQRARELSTQLHTLDTDVVEARTLLDQYAVTAAAARDLVATTRSGLSTDLGLARVLVILLGLTLAAGQIGPLWISGRLLIETSVPGLDADPTDNDDPTNDDVTTDGADTL